MSRTRPPRDAGLLATSVVIALPTLTDRARLPMTPLVCTVSLAELEVVAVVPERS